MREGGEGVERERERRKGKGEREPLDRSGISAKRTYISASAIPRHEEERERPS